MNMHERGKKLHLCSWNNVNSLCFQNLCIKYFENNFHIIKDYEMRIKFIISTSKCIHYYNHVVSF